MSSCINTEKEMLDATLAYAKKMSLRRAVSKVTRTAYPSPNDKARRIRVALVLRTKAGRKLREASRSNKIDSASQLVLR